MPNFRLVSKFWYQSKVPAAELVLSQNGLCSRNESNFISKAHQLWRPAILASPLQQCILFASSISPSDSQAVTESPSSCVPLEPYIRLQKVKPNVRPFWVSFNDMTSMILEITHAVTIFGLSLEKTSTNSCGNTNAGFSTKWLRKHECSLFSKSLFLGIKDSYTPQVHKTQN